MVKTASKPAPASQLEPGVAPRNAIRKPPCVLQLGRKFRCKVVPKKVMLGQQALDPSNHLGKQISSQNYDVVSASG